MAVLQCKMCGGSLIPVDATVCECDSCGTRQTIPNAGDDKKTNLFNRANRLRMNSEFDKAGTIYEQIAAEYPQEAEAYWGLCLCNYGIEYVDDPATGAKMPTCHRTLTTSIMEDSNFEQACDYADTIARKVYRDEAKTIDRIQKDILSIAANEAPYDVFICYKETAEDGGRTEDSVLAQDIYDALTAKGLKVFFSRITLEDKLGVQYEPYIFAALSSAKVMLAIGTAFEYYDAVWVKNEWSRFLSMMKTDKTKTLIPCFKGLDAYDMPKEFKGLQAQDMGKLGWQQDLVRGVEKLCGKGAEATSVQQTVIQQIVQAGSNAENLMKRVYLFLEDGDTKQAEKYICKVLDENAEYAPAYVARVLIRNHLKKESELPAIRKSIDEDVDWQKALRFAEEEQKNVYTTIAKVINDNESFDLAQERIAVENKRLAEEQSRLAEDEKIKEAKYSDAVAHMNRQDYLYSILYFHALGDYKGSKENLRKCIDTYIQQMQQEEEKLIQSTQDEILSCSKELSQIRGLFSGGKKRELEAKIDAIKRKLAELVQKKNSMIWTDDTIISAARDRMLQPGKYVTFGHYPQTSKGDDNTPIEWLILTRNGLNALLISRYTIDVSYYNSSTLERITWGNCTLRKWLKESFMNKAFNLTEQDAILQTNVDNSKEQGYPEYHVNGSYNTTDKVFLLSYAEAWNYFTTDSARAATPTEYVKAKKLHNDDDCCKWWLRSPCDDLSCEMFVYSNGSRFRGWASSPLAVRPAMWVNIESIVF